MKVKWMAQGSLGEAVSTKAEMCLIDDKGNGLCVPVRCKDFLSDAYYAESIGKPTEIWGFRFKNGTIKDWETAPFRMAVRLKDKVLGTKDADSMNKLLNAFFSSFGAVTVTPDGAGSLVILADNAWCKSPWRIALITMLVRQGLAYDGAAEPLAFLHEIAKNDNPICGGDGRWVGGTMKAMEALAEGRIPPELAKKDSYKAFKSTHECHHGGGIYAVFTGQHTG